jgi:hypothetical protein
MPLTSCIVGNRDFTNPVLRSSVLLANLARSDLFLDGLENGVFAFGRVEPTDDAMKLRHEFGTRPSRLAVGVGQTSGLPVIGQPPQGLIDSVASLAGLRYSFRASLSTGRTAPRRSRFLISLSPVHGGPYF